MELFIILEDLDNCAQEPAGHVLDEGLASDIDLFGVLDPQDGLDDLWKPIAKECLQQLGILLVKHDAVLALALFAAVG